MKFSQEDCNKVNIPDEVCSWCGHYNEYHDNMTASCEDCKDGYCALFFRYCQYMEERDNFWK